MKKSERDDHEEACLSESECEPHPDRGHGVLCDCVSRRASKALRDDLP